MTSLLLLKIFYILVNFFFFFYFLFFLFFFYIYFFSWYDMVSLFMEEGTVTIHKTWICQFELIDCVPNNLGNYINYHICILHFNFTGVQS